MEGKTQKTYWKGFEELTQQPSFVASEAREFAQDLPLQDAYGDLSQMEATPRRDFLKVMGFGVGAVALAACNQAPVRKSIPYLVKPEEITPGVANYYASTCGGCAAGCSVLVKTREGRPIKIDGNPDTRSLNQGALCAIGQASVLDLYDSSKAKNPSWQGKDVSWEALDQAMKQELSRISGAGGRIRVLMNTHTGPSTKGALQKFASQYPGTEVVTWDPAGYSAIADAHARTHGKRSLPVYSFDKAQVIVSFAADFLGTWISPIGFTKQYVKNRKLDEGQSSMSRHYQVEATMSLTGSRADVRIPVEAAHLDATLKALLGHLQALSGQATGMDGAHDVPGLENVARDLWNNRGKSLVISGSNNVSAQVLTNAINQLLGNYGNSLSLARSNNAYLGSDEAYARLKEELAQGMISALIIHGVNPVYQDGGAFDWTSVLKNLELSLSFSDKMDETAQHCKALAPATHYLESWDDHEPVSGKYRMTQPTISPVFNRRPWQEGILRWAGVSISWREFVQEQWSMLHSRSGSALGFRDFWDKAVHDGIVDTSVSATEPGWNYTISGDWNAVAPGDANGLQVQVYEKVGLRDGALANVPWLQELPDPVTKATWDNYFLISPALAKEQGLSEGDVIKVSASGHTLELPVLIQPGQATRTLGVALGYGRTAAGKAADGVGGNAWPFKNNFGFVAGATMSRTGAHKALAQTQTHHSFEGRDIIREAQLREYVKDPKAGNHIDHSELLKEDLWDKWEKPGHHWAMAIDLNSCTGCSACVVSCQAENNVPVVGRDEVQRRREMHWIRIDRYYSGDPQNPEVVHQPMLCQHCDHAPCESVCPVLATMHSSDGLNQQIYNRCVGTRYCANNCPFKVRRFNWFKYADNDKFDYNMNDDLGRMALNPDVVVRSRGVMEKCSFCVQNIQAGKLEAKMESRPVKDGDIKTACQTTCPGDAIEFGDINDQDSRVRKLIESDRNYFLLEELNVQPGIGYRTLIRNKPA